MWLIIYNLLIITHLQKSAIHLYRNQRLTVATSFTIDKLTLSIESKYLTPLKLKKDRNY